MFLEIERSISGGRLELEVDMVSVVCYRLWALQTPQARGRARVTVVTGARARVDLCAWFLH